MGEIFERPQPAVSLPFTGERLTSEFDGQTEIEHLHRYMVARELCRGRDVLDIASGEGYGSALLAQVARSVVGVEVAAEVVTHASANYQADNLTYRVGDARRIPLDEAAVDIVVSFETIEHFAEHAAFLTEIRRVLRPGGLLIISTPDRDTYSPMDHAANPHHVLELTRSEFDDLLRGHFGHVVTWWQRPMIGSAILPGTGVTGAEGAFCFERRGSCHFEMSMGYPRPLYLLALCSDQAPPSLPPSVYIERTMIHTFDQQERRMADMTRATQHMEAEANAARQDLSQFEAALAVEQTQLRHLKQELDLMRTSTSWRITAPLRLTMEMLRGGRR